MGFLYAFIALVFCAVLLFYFIVIPGRPNGRENGFTGVMYAHRGLHGGDVPENSLEAFRLAVENGYGIELDIRLTKDGRVIVFHDDSLERVCGDARLAADCLYEELP
ncbi:MAG TPA: glycerophosphodiester phosphodiesterase family protein, partial [Bacillota bacterium]|nr:glycerophosphodiester phosphodiesterase family protein [Bacillota bacterium]